GGGGLDGRPTTSRRCGVVRLAGGGVSPPRRRLPERRLVRRAAPPPTRRGLDPALHRRAPVRDGRVAAAGPGPQGRLHLARRPPVAGGHREGARWPSADVARAEPAPPVTSASAAPPPPTARRRA